MRVMSNGRVWRSATEWREIVTRFEGSGQSRPTFCSEEKINFSSFQRWHKRLAVSGQSDFVDVTPIPESSSSWLVEVELADGRDPDPSGSKRQRG